MSRSEALKRNSTILFWGKSLIEINMLNAVVTLFYLHRGVPIDKIFYLSIVWSITALLFEVPTGYLADRFGRKRTILLGTFLLALSWGATWFAQGFPAFILIFILMSASFSCFSGTEEALLYDSLQEIEEERDMIKHTGRLHSAQHLFNIFIPALGAWIARDLLEPQFLLLIAINFIATIGSFYIFFLLLEPKHVKNVTAYEKDIFRESIETIKHEPFLFRASLNRLLIFIAAFITWRAYQPFLSAHGISVFWLGIFYLLLHGIIFILHQRIAEIEKRLGTTRILSWSIFGMGITLATIFVTDIPWILFFLVLTPLILESTRSPLFAHMMNRRIHSRSRATTLSHLNAIKGVLDIPILFLSGALAKMNMEYIFIIAIMLCVVTLCFFSICTRDIVEAN